jgi:hypothetical protein
MHFRLFLANILGVDYPEEGVVRQLTEGDTSYRLHEPMPCRQRQKFNSAPIPATVVSEMLQKSKPSYRAPANAKSESLARFYDGHGFPLAPFRFSCKNYSNQPKSSELGTIVILKSATIKQ